MSTPLPDGLDAIERRLEATIAKPAPGLRARVLSAARAQRSVRPLPPRERSFWVAASAAAAVLLLLNFARGTAFESQTPRAPSRALCASVLRDADPSNVFVQALLHACPPRPAPTSIEELP